MNGWSRRLSVLFRKQRRDNLRKVFAFFRDAQHFFFCFLIRRARLQGIARRVPQGDLRCAVRLDDARIEQRAILAISQRGAVVIRQPAAGTATGGEVGGRLYY